MEKGKVDEVNTSIVNFFSEHHDGPLLYIYFYF